MKLSQAERNFQEGMNLALGVMEKSVTDMISKSIPDELGDKEASKEAKEQASETNAKRMARVHELVMEQISVHEVIEQVFIPLYDKYYSESELKDLIAFYKTPTGQKSVAVQPQLTGEGVSRTLEYLKPKMEAITKQISEEMLKK